MLEIRELAVTLRVSVMGIGSVPWRRTAYFEAAVCLLFY